MPFLDIGLARAVFFSSCGGLSGCWHEQRLLLPPCLLVPALARRALSALRRHLCLGPHFLHGVAALSSSVVLRPPTRLLGFAKSACCKCIFQVFQRYVASVSYGCCICCNDYTHMLQVSVPNVTSVFFP
jgi:hypothetical protein